MRNLIGGGKHILTEDNCVLSFARLKDKDHSFIVIESLNGEGELIMEEAHLRWQRIYDKDGQPVLDSKNHIKVNKKKAEISFSITKPQHLQEMGKNCVGQSWDISLEQKKKLEEKILADQKLDIDFIHFGKSYAAGFFGASLDGAGLGDLKQASIASNDTLLDNKLSGYSYASVAATLKTGHSCVSWARETVLYVLNEKATAADLESLQEPFFVNLPVNSNCLIL